MGLRERALKALSDEREAQHKVAINAARTFNEKQGAQAFRALQDVLGLTGDEAKALPVRRLMSRDAIGEAAHVEALQFEIDGLKICTDKDASGVSEKSLCVEVWVSTEDENGLTFMPFTSLARLGELLEADGENRASEEGEAA